MISFLNQVNFLVVFNNYVNTIYTNQRIFHREERKLNLDHPWFYINIIYINKVM